MVKKKQNKKSSFFKRGFQESWNYIKESRNFIYSIIFIFLLFALIGFFLPAPAILEQKILEFIEELLKETQGMSSSELISFIFFNNLQSSFLGMIFGIFLGIFSVLTTLANGYVIGFVAAKTVESSGISVLWRLLPHGIFELPALFISLGLGLKLGSFVFRKKKLETLKQYLKESAKVFLFIIIPLLIIAAIIEGSLIFLLG
ncbi:MAG: stage II sporulation protein M [Candidatus Pacearchaeota archaeon]|nr:stage II sporulation protein M [Candidatus Pacearchaeota archaeon]